MKAPASSSDRQSGTRIQEPSSAATCRKARHLLVPAVRAAHQAQDCRAVVTSADSRRGCSCNTWTSRQWLRLMLQLTSSVLAGQSSNSDSANMSSPDCQMIGLHVRSKTVHHLLGVAAARQERHHPLAALPFAHLWTHLWYPNEQTWDDVIIPSSVQGHGATTAPMFGAHLKHNYERAYTVIPAGMQTLLTTSQRGRASRLIKSSAHG